VHPAVTGGNPALKPESSEQFNAGVVWEPVSGLSLAVDYWKINQSNVIGALDPSTIFDNFAYYAPTNIIRGPVDPAHPDLPGPIDMVILTQQNLGSVRTSGIDVDVRWRGRATALGRVGFSLNGTYLIDWKAQPDGLNYESGVGRNSPFIPGQFPRWKHYASLDWERGAWAATIAQTYQSGYEDVNVYSPRVVPPPPPRRVSSYDVWDLQGRYSGFRNATIVFGIKNAFDRDPPFTNQPFFVQTGYDPSYADPRGRSFYARLTYAFK
jgi:iron complex outermembrane receptor protein